MTIVDQAQQAVKALREPNAAFTNTPNTIRQSIADIIEILTTTCVSNHVEIERLRGALGNFASQKNWHLEAGLLQWTGKRSAIEFAQSVLEPPK